ncbi:AfsR/SARP family transcriptional regulator [Streptomyces sp. NRRL B-24484]|uniref:AfsR/SARP family transcriptional regulator n=1 Tax=Streptomyces sp. NRRL B-24484 TaxID=1463833 RepID=UPI0004C24C90|nr:BTAD domain-containing putative transcriptional regulator [Streptomyces sp. NRRL B-24484]
MREGPQRRRIGFKILGSLECWEGEERIRLGGPLQERVLATLLLEAGRLVPVARLVEAAWEDEPPGTAPHQVRKIIADLRRRLPAGVELILTDGPGYRIALEPDQLDLGLFGVRLDRAREAVAAGLRANAVDQLRAALDLWRGPVLSGLATPVLQAAATALEERRLAATEQLLDLRLELGEAAELVGDLREAARQHPLRETLRGRLILALYRSGRQAEAIEEYGRVRELLAEELGIDPGPELAALHQAILRGSPELAAPPRPAAEEPPQRGPHALGPAPSAIPYDLADFTGREDELERLLELAAAPGDRGTRIIAIDGMGGSGKTALAIHAAHRLAGQYPDGRLHIDLHGFTPQQPPLAPAEAVDVLLRILGLPGDQIPDDLPSRVALWRVVTAGRRLLIVLDNASDAEQVRALLPASADCLVLVTSRVRLVDLDGVESMSLGLMSVADSTALVERTLDGGRAAADPAATAELVRLCGRLPLALRISTARLRKRPLWTVRHLVDRLADETRTLTELSAGERSVAASLRLSYLSMEPECRTALRLLGQHPGTDVDVHSAAALLGVGSAEAEDLLEQLLDAHLLEQQEFGRYSFHDLVRSFAHGLRGADTAEPDAASLTRLLDYYVLAVEAACERLFPGRLSYGVDLPAVAVDLPPLPDTDSALGWFRGEHRSLLAAVRLAARSGRHWHAAYLPRGLTSYLRLQGCPDENQEVGRIAVDSARAAGDLQLLRLGLTNLAVALWPLGRIQEGVACLNEARELAVRLGDRAAEAACLSRLGIFHNSLGEYTEGLDLLHRALPLHRASASPREEAATLVSISSASVQLGRYAEAAEAARGGVDLHRGLGEPDNGALGLINLAAAQLGLGEVDSAMAAFGEAYEIQLRLGQSANTGLVLARLAEAHHRLGRLDEARENGLRALDLIWSSGLTTWKATAENILGRIQYDLDEHLLAQERHGHALRLAEQIGSRIEAAYALDGLALTALALGDPDGAREHRRRADGLFDRMGVPEQYHRPAALRR